jgi:mono/diheme cytochrome c family protein
VEVRQTPPIAVRASVRLLLTVAVLLLAGAQVVTLGLPLVRTRLTPPEETAAGRGLQLAASLGCFNCHGSDGNGGTRNPRFAADSEADERWLPLGEFGDVPAFARMGETGQPSTQDLREYIVDGAPRHKLEDPAYRKRIAETALRMPAYRRFVTDREVDDLIAFLEAASRRPPADPLAARGAEVAAAAGCFACHGPLGAGGKPNPGSLKGYIPGFLGSDFEELVRNDEELRGWIADGQIERIAQHPVGRHFLRRQAVRMPEFGEFLPPADIDALVAYVKWIHAGRTRTGAAP